MVSIDDQAIGELITESKDLQSDAMKTAKQDTSSFADLGADLRRSGASQDPARQAQMWDTRRGLTRKLGLTAGSIGLGGFLLNLFGSPAGAQEPVEVQMLQTASSLEILAVATYGAALTLPFIKDGNKVVVAFAETTMAQHDEHRAAFQARTEAIGGTAQTTANPKYAPVVEQAKPTLMTPADVVELAATLEQVATETYLANLNMFADAESRTLMASVMGVEAQHLATLRAVGALLGAAPELIAIPTDVAKLPAAAGSVAFPDAIQGTTMASPPEEGAVQ
jgi:hypothetical protein